MIFREYGVIEPTVRQASTRAFRWYGSGVYNFLAVHNPALSREKDLIARVRRYHALRTCGGTSSPLALSKPLLVPIFARLGTNPRHSNDPRDSTRTEAPR